MKYFLDIMLLVLILHLFGVAESDEGKELQDNKQELHSIKKQLEETQDKVDSLKQMEESIQREISQYGERVARNRKLVERLRNQLKTVRYDLSRNVELLDQTTERMHRKRQRYSRMIVDYYLQRNAASDFSPWDFDSHLAHKRSLYYLKAVSSQTSREIGQAGDSVRLLTQNVDSLQQTGSDLNQLQQEKKARIDLDLTLKDKEEASLGTVRRQTNMMQDRLVSLSAAAREMEDIVARLEQAQRERRRLQGPPERFREGSFAQLKGRLTPPIKGKIVKSFGWKTDQVTNLKSFSPGIDIQPFNNQKYIIAGAPGRVAYVGRMRGYDNFVILEHDDGYYSTYAGLASCMVELDDLVDAGERIGVKGDDNFHFELRKGREHLDPVIWLDIDAF